MATSDDNRLPAERAVTRQRLADVVGDAREERAAAAALRAEAGQARRRANAILDSAVAIVETVLERRGITLAEPVAAKFRTDESGSGGIEISVRLKEPDRAPFARSAIIERFGGESRSDRLIVV
ncbi:MAG TPA: hypothetical protein VFZ00_10040 [Solirubrobacter sp.]|nr:hypothetical protein [Solirubrobacter sp.]